VDTNILISALLKPLGNEWSALVKARDMGTVLLSPELRFEYFKVLNRKKFDKYLSIETRLEFFAAICDEALELVPSREVRICRDPKDNMLLELALEAQADAIITGDADLLVLHPFQNIPILNASDFLEKSTKEK
jgi:uncharacterized protein